MSELKWRGCGADSYVSHDGRFLVARADKLWALYGRVEYEGDGAPWGWGDRPLYQHKVKRQCQGFAADAHYEVPRVPGETRKGEEEETAECYRGYHDCVECGVRFIRKDGWIWAETCGKNCAEIQAERVDEIKRKAAAAGRRLELEG